MKLPARHHYREKSDTRYFAVRTLHNHARIVVHVESANRGQSLLISQLEQEKQNGTPGLLSHAEGTNVTHVAERVGFEPTVDSRPQRFSSLMRFVLSGPSGVL
jgi:hypothetical protein